MVLFGHGARVAVLLRANGRRRGLLVWHWGLAVEALLLLMLLLKLLLMLLLLLLFLLLMVGHGGLGVVLGPWLLWRHGVGGDGVLQVKILLLRKVGRGKTLVHGVEAKFGRRW